MEQEDGVCKAAARRPEATIKSYKAIPPSDENAMMYAVANYGPLSVSIHATTSFMYYKGAEQVSNWATKYVADHCQHYQPIFYDKECEKKLNHAVLVTGYGTYKGRKYWIVKNSYGTSWGR